MEQIIESYDELDTSKIFKVIDAKSKFKEDIQAIEKGKQPDPKIKDEADKINQVKNILSEAKKTKDPLKQAGLAQYLTKLNETKRETDEPIQE